MRFDRDVLVVDCPKVTDEVCSFIREQTLSMRRDGAVIGVSGGVDSALILHLCVKALGKERVLGLLIPERESDPVSAEYATAECQRLGIRALTVDITNMLHAAGAYTLRDEAIRALFPEYGSRHRSKIVLPGDLISKDALNFYTLVVEDESGNSKSVRINNRTLRQIVAASNLKQRTRMMYLYRFAEAENYLVCGTTNRTEDVQGFFVKYGDGGVDIEPIARLYKTQVYQLAEYMGVSGKIIQRAPTPDTFSLRVTDEEFYFRVPYDKLDLLLYAWENHIAAAMVSDTMGLSEIQVNRVFRDLTSKYNATKHLHSMPPCPDLHTAKSDPS